MARQRKPRAVVHVVRNRSIGWFGISIEMPSGGEDALNHAALAARGVVPPRLICPEQKRHAHPSGIVEHIINLHPCDTQIFRGRRGEGLVRQYVAPMRWAAERALREHGYVISHRPEVAQPAAQPRARAQKDILGRCYRGGR